jgi:hypothetical protein
MTGAGISVSAPHGKVFYAAVAILASLFGFGFAWGAVAMGSFAGVPLHTPLLWRVAQAGVAAVFLLGALQAFERWLAPLRAQARSAAISDVAHARLLVLRSLLVWTGATGYVIYFVMHLAGDRVPDIGVLSAVFQFAGLLVADLCGERR